MSALKAALEYIAGGMRPIPVPYMSKGPIIEGWQNLAIGAAEAPRYFNGGPQNVGLILGHNGLADADLDCPEAIITAQFLMPRTRRFGHASKPLSHYTCISPGLAKIETVAARKLLAPDGSCLLEIRSGGGGAGAQTIFPPSTHVSGEPIEWEDENTPIATVTPEEFIKACHWTTAAALLARFYPKEGSRHDGSLALGGFLAGCGISAGYIKLIVEAVGVASGQPREKIKDMIRTTDGAGLEKRAGLPKMRKIFGPDVTKKVADWLGYKGPHGVEDNDNVSGLGKDHGFIKGDNNQILKGHPANTRIALFRIGVTLHYNEFSGQIELRGMPSASLDGDMSDHRAVRLRLLIQERFNFRPSLDAFRDILTDEAHQHSYHPVRDYIAGLRWDGVKRIDTWLTDYAGAEDTEFNRAAGRLWLIAGVRRVRCPGVKFDTILVFESPVQGLNKSTAMRVMAVRDEWFTDCLPLGGSAKETIEVSQGIWIVEFGELSGMQRRDRESILTFLSRQEDQARLAYGHYKERVRRQFIGGATTNKEEYLSHEERRLLPARIKKFDHEKLRLDRDQLWAEAAHYEAQGEAITLPEKLWPAAAKVRAARRIQNPFVPRIRGLLEGKGWPDKVDPEDLWVALGEDFTNQLGMIERRAIPVERRARQTSALGEAMKDLGYSLGKQDWSRGANRGRRLYEKNPDSEEATESASNPEFEEAL